MTKSQLMLFTILIFIISTKAQTPEPTQNNPQPISPFPSQVQPSSNFQNPVPALNSQNPQPSQNVEPNPQPSQVAEPNPQPSVSQFEPNPQPLPLFIPQVQPSPIIQNPIPALTIQNPQPFQNVEPNPQPSQVAEPNPQPTVSQFEPNPQPLPLLVPQEQQPSPIIDPIPEPNEPPVRFCNQDNVYETHLDGHIDGIYTVNETVSFLWTQRELGSKWLWRSTDGGATWVEQSPYLEGIDDFSTPPLKLRVKYGGIYSVTPSANPSRIYILGNNGNFWMTSNGGDSYVHYSQNHEFYKLIPHPFNEEWLIGIHYSQTCWNDSSDIDECFYISFDGYRFRFKASVSFNSGKTWKPMVDFLDPKVGAFWGNDNKTIYAMSTTSQLIKSLKMQKIDFIKILNFEDTVTILEDVIAMLYIQESSTILIGKVVNRKFNLYVSADNGESFTNPQFPVVDPKANADSYVILDTTQGSIVVGVQKNTENYDRIDLYVSDQLGNDFALSLQDVIISPDLTYTEFQRPTGIPGIYIVNYYANDTLPLSAISFNKGGKWFNIPPPEKERCNGCYLNLYGPMYGSTIDTALDDLGIIVGLGNVNTQLRGNFEKTNLYISKDAGLTWDRLHDGVWLFDLSSRGEQIFLVDTLNPTHRIKYTNDLGNTWDECSFVYDRDRKFNVLSMSTEVGGRNSSAWIFTSWLNRGKVNFSLFYLNMGKTEQLPACAENDYEHFNPSGPQDECILGQNIIYNRKKPGAKCKSDPTILKQKTVIVCDCAIDDYLCNYCYLKVDDKCVMNMNNAICKEYNEPPSSCEPGSNYTSKPSYRKVSGSVCVRELTDLLEPVLIPCPQNEKTPIGRHRNSGLSNADIFGIAFGVFIFVGVLVVVIISVIVAKIRSRNTFQMELGGETQKHPQPETEPTKMDASESVAMTEISLNV